MTSFGITDRGLVRQVNEDEYFRSDSPVGCLPNLYVVADGMGGHNAGDVASRDSIHYFKEYMTEADFGGDPKQLFDDAFAYANSKVFNEGIMSRELQGMGTTMVAASVFGDSVLVGNVGDSRLYTYGEGIRQITIDHSVVEELYRAGQITETEKFHHPDRNMITRAIGVDDRVEMDFFTVEKKSCRLVLVCSDGLTKMMTDLEIEQVLKGQGSLRDKVENLVAAALRNGGRDNITVILIDLQEEVGL